MSEMSWKKNFINFIIDLSSNKRENVIYNTIFMIIDRCTKMIKYLSMIIKIDAAKLIKLFFKKLFYILISIVNDKNFLFINVF